jgi:hypothetical protein
MTTTLAGNKDQFIQHITQIATKSEQDNQTTRTSFEQGDLDSRAHWVKYAAFEQKEGQHKRALAVFERAFSQSEQMQQDLELWLLYIEHISSNLKDVSLARAKYEQRLNNAQLLSAGIKIDLLIENAKFEEVQSNSLRARKIYEQLDE